MDIEPIRNRRVLREIESLMHARRNTAEGDRLDVLVPLVEAWEAKHYPLASDKRGYRIRSRRGSGSSTPPNGSIRRRIASQRCSRPRAGLALKRPPHGLRVVRNHSEDMRAGRCASATRWQLSWRNAVLPPHRPSVLAMISSQRLPSAGSATLTSPPKAARRRFEGWPAKPQRHGRWGKSVQYLASCGS